MLESLLLSTDSYDFDGILQATSLLLQKKTMKISVKIPANLLLLAPALHLFCGLPARFHFRLHRRAG
jgi:hypothetical protein